MIKNKKIFLAIAILAMVFVSNAFAENQANIRDDTFSYIFHLYYDNGQLISDRDYQFSYDIVAEQFISQADGSIVSSLFEGKIFDNKDELIYLFKFDPKNGDQNFNKGKISVKGPYYAYANRVEFYNNAGLKLLTISVSSSSFCNEDKKCDSDVGENYKNCPSDCAEAVSLPMPVQEEPFVQSKNIFYTILPIVGIILIVLLLIWAIIKIIKKRRNGELPPTVGS